MGMRAIFNLGKSRPVPGPEAVQAQAPQLREAELAAIYYGQRMGGDFYDFIRVSPDRVLFGLMDVAGRLEENHPIVNAAQETFRTLGAELFAKEDINEAEAMIELCLGLNHTILQAAGGVRSCPAFAGCLQRDSRHRVFLQCRPHLGTDAESQRNHRTDGHRAAPGIVFAQHLRCVYGGVGAALDAVAGVPRNCRGEASGQEFGLEQLKEGFQRSQAASAKELCLSILDQVQQFMHTPPTHNDVTTLALARMTAPGLVAAEA